MKYLYVSSVPNECAEIFIDKLRQRTPANFKHTANMDAASPAYKPAEQIIVHNSEGG